MKSLIIFTFLFLTSFQQVSAQAISQKEMLKSCAADEIGQLNDYISFMADKTKSVDKRRYYKTKALDLFIGGGYSYEENDTEKAGAMIEIASADRKSVAHKLIRNYFDNLISLNYNNVKIVSTEIAKIKVSDLQKIDEDLYVCTCAFDQVFVGYRDGKAVYKDITTKRIKCYIRTSCENDGEYIIKIGDITALSTNRN